MITPDTLTSMVKEMASPPINWTQFWLQIVVQTALFGIIIEFLRRKFQKELEFLKNEFTIIQTTFSNNYSTVIDYYSIFFKHYRDCQSVAYTDIINYPDAPSIRPEDIFWKNINEWVERVYAIEAKIKLILPDRILQIHEKSFDAFNGFRDLVKSYDRAVDKPNDKLHAKFVEIDKIKQDLAAELKIYLRTEKLYPE